MSLEDYKIDMETCRRCSACKFIPLEKINGSELVNVCPSISRYNFHSYSGGGRMVIGAAMLAKRIDYSDKLLEVVYNCQMCGACDVSCKYAIDMEVLESINEFRNKCVADGHSISALDSVIASLRKQGTMVSEVKNKRGDWAEGLKVKDITKDKAPVVYFAGCRTCYDPNTWKIARANVNLLQKCGVDIGVAGSHEICCGGRAYEMGYKSDFLKQAERIMTLLKNTGVKTLVTGCAECYQAFKVLYDKFNLKGDLEVLHTTEYFDRLIKEGKLKSNKRVDVGVTYHDPCHLGRLSEPYVHWKGKVNIGHIRTLEPPKEYRRGTHGVYEPPRNVLKNIPGVNLVEMSRIKEYSWCCGAGGGVKESNEQFANWTANERIKEAELTGAEIIATSCPGCYKNLNDAIKEAGSSLKVYDVAELLEKSI